MSYTLKDIRNLRIEWNGESISYQAASVCFESGNERFHIWLRPNKTGGLDDLPNVTFAFADTLYANAIEQPQYGHIKTKRMDINAPTHRKLREYMMRELVANYSDLDNAIGVAASRYRADRNKAEARFNEQYAKNIREALMALPKPSSMVHDLLQRSDAELIELRGALLRAAYPESREFHHGVIGKAEF